MTNTTRTLYSHGPDNNYIEGLTKGPRAGWTWTGTALTHPLGITIALNPAAAARVAEAVNAYRPGKHEQLTGYQINHLPDEERAVWLAGLAESDTRDNGYGGYTTDDGVHTYTRYTEGTFGTCTFDTSEVTAFTVPPRGTRNRTPEAVELDPLSADAAHLTP